ncbi:MAG TPA: adenylate/guanylate cyclase domain-containing protein [Mycobacteriales bacterium]|nr:adenylate/guanylate cyclase domain-containing protein [Mycobacteriales bacterium]
MLVHRATTVLLLTDVGGSTRLWRTARAEMNAAMARHDEIIDDVIREHGGRRPPDQGEGDSKFAAFGAAGPAIEAALALQTALLRERWPTPEPLRVRVGVHAGDVVKRGEDLLGEAVSRCARLRDIGHPGQVLVSSAVEAILGGDLPAGASLIDLGDHRLPDLARPERVFQLCHPDLPTDFPALRSLNAVRHNLPLQLSSFVGRTRAVSTVMALLSEHRLVTITGFGGVGKTRLALQVAGRIAAQSAGGTYFVDLSTVREPGLLLHTVAAALDVRAGESRNLLPALSKRLGTEDVLLVLDNLEQVVAAAPALLDLLGSAAGLRILATSREPLHLRGEREFALEPLAVPVTSQTHEVLAAYESVELFIDRARDVLADFAVDNESAPAVAEICARLEGLPLAIELAAARVKTLPPRALLARLTGRMGLPGVGARDLPERHQTLHATIAWSYDLLDQVERDLLARLSVFAGGTSPEAVEAVCSAECPDVVGLLSSLVDKSLVRFRTDDDGEPRYALFQAVREYAAERLAEQPDGGQGVGDRHAAYFRDSVAALVVGRFTEPPAVAYVHRELDNLWAALDHFRKGGQVDAEAQLLADMADAAWHRGHWDELIRRSVEVLGRTRQPSETSFTLLDCVAVGSLTSDLARAEAWSLRAIDEAAALGRPVLEGRSWIWLAHLHQLRGELDRAEEAVRRGLSLARSAAAESPRYQFYDRDVVLCEGTAMEAGLAIRRAQWAAAQASAAQAVELARNLGDVNSMIRGQVRSGGAALGAGLLDEARAAFVRAADLCRADGVRGYLPLLLSQLADVERRRGDVGAARRSLSEAERVSSELGVHEPFVDVVLADCELDQADPEAADEVIARLRGGTPPDETAVRTAMVEARLASSLGDIDGARRHVASGLRACMATGLLSGISALLRLGAAALRSSDSAAARTLLAASAAHESDPGPVFLRGLIPCDEPVVVADPPPPLDALIALITGGRG